MKEKLERANFMISADRKRDIEIMADEEDRKFSAMVRVLLNEAINAREKRD